MPLSRLWAGKAFGTNTGNLFVKLQGEDKALTGTLRFNDDANGMLVYGISGTFDGSALKFTGTVQLQQPGHVAGQLVALALLRPTGNLGGEWETTAGTGGTFVLFPHDNPEIANAAITPDQYHTARYIFKPIEITREQIVALADDIQKDFPKARLVVTIVADTEQSRFLDDYKKRKPNADKAALVKLYISEPESGGTNRVVSVEFGQQTNSVMTQGGTEEWVLGTLEKLKREIRPFERVYTPNVEWMGLNVNQLLLLGAIAFLPSLSGLRDRAIFLGAVYFLTLAVNWFNAKFLPHSSIYLTAKREGLVARVGPSVWSWCVGIAASVIATLLGAYLNGVWKLTP
jgi:hypothetical protein